MEVTRTEIRAELYRRSFYKFSLDAFKALHNGKELTSNWHIEYLCNEVQQVVENLIQGNKRDKHLLINVPPRTLKSELINVFLSCWLWTKDDSKKFISTSYSYTLSQGLSTQARRIIESDWFKNHFPYIQINKDENTKQKFTTAKGGLRYATSTGGTVTGLGADIIVIDDPQNPQLARSDKERDNANAFFNETLRSRLNEPDKGVFIVIMQRLHEQDLTGMLLELEPENWKHICLPAEISENVKPARLKKLYTNGLLFEQRLNESTLNSFKIGLGSYGYSGQYGQTPSPSDGGLLKRNWFNIIDELPKYLTFDFFLDTAYTDKSTNDATALMCTAYKDNFVYIKSIKEVRLEFPELIKEIQNFAINNGYTSSSKIYIEPKASGKSIAQQLKRNTGLNIIEDKPPTQDKISRVNSISPIVESGRVMILNKMGIENFLDQCAAFPNGTHDDMVDTLVMAIDIYTARKKTIRAFTV